MKHVGYWQYHATEAPKGDYQPGPLMPADREAGWTEQAVYIDEKEKPA